MKRSRARGFTLIEVLIGAVVFSIIISAAFMMIIRWNQINAKNEALTEALTQGRQAINLIAKDVEGAYYIYDYATTFIGEKTEITVAEPGNSAVNLGQTLADVALAGGQDQGQADSSGGQFFTPLVTWSIPKTTQLPIHYPYSGSTGAMGIAGLQTDVLTMVATSMVVPSYVCYFRVPGASDSYTGPSQLANHLVRLTMTCSNQPGGSQGAWYEDSVPWNSPSMAYSAGATSSVHFEGGTTDTTWDGNDDCTPADVQVLCPVGNDASGSLSIFDITTPHPYSNVIPMSPYVVHVHLLAGDPTNNFLKTSTNSTNVDNINGHEYASLQMDLYARNVTLPEPN